MNWLKSNKLSLNDDKTKIVLDDCAIIIEEEKVRSKKYLGLAGGDRVPSVGHHVD